MEIEYVTPRIYLRQVYEGFCKEANISIHKPVVGWARQLHLREQSMDDILMFCKEQGVDSIEARKKDKDNGLYNGCFVETWLQTYTVKQDIVLCTTKDFYAGLSEQEKIKKKEEEDEEIIAEKQENGKTLCWKLKKDKRTGVSHLILVNDPTALDEMPDFNERRYPPKKIWESAVDYASRLQEIDEERTIKAMEDLAHSTGGFHEEAVNLTDGPEDDTDGLSEVDTFPDKKSIIEYFNLPD